MTKSFTAMAVVRLRDAGRLELDDPAERWVPERRGLRYPTSDSPRATIRHLLTHAAGLPEDDPWTPRKLDTRSLPASTANSDSAVPVGAFGALARIPLIGVLLVAILTVRLPNGFSSIGAAGGAAGVARSSARATAARRPCPSSSGGSSRSSRTCPAS
jgi:hypothetical protein